MRNVLVTSGGGFQGLAIIKGLQRIPGVRTVLADCYADNIGRFFAGSFHVSPLVCDEGAFLQFLEQIIEAENIDTIIPSTDHELETLARYAARFVNMGVQVAVSDRRLLEILKDKRKTYRLFRRAGISVLPFLNIRSTDSLAFPVIGKPVTGFGSKGQCIIQSGAIPGQATSLLSDKSYLWQPYLEDAIEFSVDFAIDFSGNVSPLVARRRIRTFSGFAILGETALDEPDVLGAAHRAAVVLSRLGGRGGFNIQFLKTAHQLVLIDLNARFGTSSALTIEAGINLQSWLLGEDLEYRPKPGRLFRYLAEGRAPSTPLAVSGVVFDLDDTILDQKVWIADKLTILWDDFKDLLPPQDEFLAHAFLLLEEGNRAWLLDELITAFGLSADLRTPLIDRYRQIIPSRVEVYCDAVRVIAELRRRGIKIGLLTDNPPESQRKKIAQLPLAFKQESAFDAIVLTGEIGYPKPHPRGFQIAASALGIEPARLAMVGDNLYRDALGALAAGYKHAFLVQRQGAFFNFNQNLAMRIPSLSEIPQLADLDQLLWHISG